MVSSREIKIPRVVRIEPAGKCNLSCIHCPTGTVNMDRGIMDWKTFEKILEFIKKYDEIKVVVLYHGGEPLLNKNFYLMASEIKKIRNDIFLKTVSNGFAMTKNNCKKLVECKIDQIEFSLDGESLIENNHIRIGSDGKKVIDNINLLIEEKKILKSKNPAIYIATTQFIRNDQVDNVQSGLDIGGPDIPKYLIDIFQNRVDGFKATYALQWPHMGTITKYFTIYTNPNEGTSNECDHLENAITIRWDGDVVPCCYDLTSKLVMGNIKNESLENIWRGSKYSILRKSIQDKKFISICRGCAVVTPNRYLVPKHKNIF